jgi:hypothetical protein
MSKHQIHQMIRHAVIPKVKISLQNACLLAIVPRIQYPVIYKEVELNERVEGPAEIDCSDLHGLIKSKR